MVHQEGVTSLFRGLTPNLARAVLMNVSQLATYDFFKGSLLSSGYFEEGTLLHFSASFLAGTVATTVCSPADVVKARVMAAQGSGSGVIGALGDSVRKEGVKFLFRGWSPAWIRLSPNVSIMRDSRFGICVQLLIILFTSLRHRTQTILIFVTLEKMRVFVDWSREKRGLPSHRTYKRQAKQFETQQKQ